jgi:EmrB/QacA subfamily drug resistance transporter
MKQIVVGTDGSASATETVRQAAELACSADATLHIVGAHGGDPGGFRAILEDAAREVRATRVQVWLHSVAADPATALCSIARRVHADLIVVGNRGIAHPLRRVRRPVCDQVERCAPCSVMVVDTEPYWHVVAGVDPASSGSASRSRIGRDWQVLMISTLAVFMALLDVTIVNVAFPAIHRSFAGTSLPDLSWVLNAYNVVVAALLVPAGRLADRVGRRRVFFGGLGLFLLGSVFSGAAPTADVLIGARILQAVGAATLIPSSFGLVLVEFAPERRATATSVWAAAGAIAAAAGPSLGGVLVQSANWRWAFFVNLFFALGMLPARRLLRESRDPETRDVPDFFGGALLAMGIGALAMGIVKAPDWGWTSDRVLGLWSAAAVLIVWLWRRSFKHRSPVLEPELLRIPMFGLSNAAFFVFSMGFYALLLGNILFLTQVWGYSILTAGFAVTPGPLMAAIAAAIGGKLTDRFGPRAVALPALLTFAGACLVYRGVGATPAYLSDWLPAQIISGSSIGFAFAALTTASVMDLPPNRLATGTAITSCFRQVGAVLGIAGLIAIIGTPSPLVVMHAFEHAWLLMSLTALGAAAFVLPFDRRRPGQAAVPAPIRPRRQPVHVPGLERRELLLHGHRVCYRTAGSGPVLLLVHGLLEDSLTWRKLAPALALGHKVVAVDLLGHGESDGPADVDYSLAGHVWMLRDVLDALGHERVTVVGHSLGGAIALAFAGFFPERVERLVLLAPGGFGREVHPLLRLMAMPGSGPALRACAGRVPRALLRAARGALRRLGANGAARGASELYRVLVALADSSGRSAFMRSLRTVIDRRGQSATALDRLSVFAQFPMLLLWGTADRVIPVSHGLAAAERLPDAQLVLLDGVGHVPHITQASFIAQRIAEFVRRTSMHRNGAADAGAGARARFDAQLAAESADSVGHVLKPTASASGGEVEPASVI